MTISRLLDTTSHWTGLKPLSLSGSCHRRKTAVFHRYRVPPVARWLGSVRV